MFASIGRLQSTTEPIRTKMNDCATSTDALATVSWAAEYLRFTFIPQIMAFADDEAGQDLIEYALVTALVGIGLIAAIKTMSSKINSAFTTIGTTLTSTV